MLKRLSFLIVFILLGAACSSNQEVQTQVIKPTTQAQSTEGVQSIETKPEKLAQALTTIITTEPTATVINTPIPPTKTPHPTSTPTPTLTPTPRPITHANIGWEGYDTEARDPFPDEMRIKSEIIGQNQNNQMLNGITEEDIRIVWYQADDGTVFWHPYFTLNNDRVNNDLYLYIYSLETDSDGNLSLIPSPKMLNVTALERLGAVQKLTDIQLLWHERTNQPVLAIEKNGLQFWYPDELQQNLVSYDQNLSAVGFPEMPESAKEFATVLFAYYPQDVYLFNYDETATTTAGIGAPNDGPVYKLVDNQWQVVDPPEFIGGGPPQFAYIGVDDTGEGNLYIEQLTPLQTPIQIWSNVNSPLVPAHVARDAEASDTFGYDYYYLLASPVWSPDGEKVAFIAQENGSPHLAVYDVQAQTWQSLVQLPQSVVLFDGPIWSPDGMWLAYSYRTSTSANFDTLRVVSYPEAYDYYIDQSGQMQWVEDDDGLHLSYGKYSGELFVADPDGSNIEPITYAASPQSLNNPVVGYAIIEEYVPEHNAFLVHRYNQEDGFDKLVYVPLDGSEEILLAELPTNDGACGYSKFLLSPDGIWLLTYKRCQEGEVSTFQGFYLLNLQTQESKETSDWQYRFIEGWTPDSKGIVEYNSFGVFVYGLDDLTSSGLVYAGQVFPLRAVLRTLKNNGVLYWPDVP